MIRGLFKKVCIADLLVEFIVVFEQVPEYTAPVVIGLAILQGFRIYYDFAGDTNMAIGLAQMLNLTIPENFDRPYFSTSLQEFWRRWHMSLNSWIRDYIYIPLGGNRRHRGVNLLSAMVLCGLRHGAAWNFPLWDLYHGVGLGLENLLQRRRPEWFVDHRVFTPLRWFVCYGFVTVGWLLFFYPASTVWKMTVGPLRAVLGSWGRRNASRPTRSRLPLSKSTGRSSLRHIFPIHRLPYAPSSGGMRSSYAANVHQRRE